MKTKLLIWTNLSILPFIGLSEEIQAKIIAQQTIEVDNPAAFLTKNFSHSESEQLWKTEFDINRDGRNDLLLAFDHNRNGAAGLVWHVFLSQSNGKYLTISDLISFRYDASTFGKIGDDTQNSLITYSPGGAGMGALSKYHVEGDKVIEEIVSNEFKPQGADAGAYEKLFSKDNLIKVEDVSKAASNEKLPSNQDDPKATVDHNVSAQQEAQKPEEKKNFQSSQLAQQTNDSHGNVVLWAVLAVIAFALGAIYLAKKRK